MNQRGSIVLWISVFVIGVVLALGIGIGIKYYQEKYIAIPEDQFEIASTSQIQIENKNDNASTAQIITETINVSSTQIITKNITIPQVKTTIEKKVSSLVATTTKNEGELCGGEYWSKCSVDEKFICSPSGEGACLPKDYIFCGGKYWTPCVAPSKFYCPITGDAYCALDNARYEPSSIVPNDINSQSIVALNCHYKSKKPQNYSSQVLGLGGTGVIINSEGYILTAKHLVDPEWVSLAFPNEAESQLNDVREFEYCEVGLPPKNITLPTIENIQNPDQGFDLDPPFPYIATIYFNPQQGNLSDTEYKNLDFVIMKITRVLDSCQSFSGDLCNLPNSFPYTPVLYQETVKDNDKVINFGYPSVDYSATLQGSVTGFILKGAVGFLENYYTGDKYFNNKPFVFNWIANNLVPGRSGSPVFFRGYVAGIVYASNYLVDKTQGTAIGMPAIQQILTDNGLKDPLSTK